MKTQFKVAELKKIKFNIGDKVNLIDGSSITSEKKEDILIVSSYPDITGTDKTLKNIVGVVVENNVIGHYCSGVLGEIYEQDLKITLGEGVFYTNSSMVCKLKDALDTQAFYDIMYAYRMCQMDNQDEVTRRFEAVKNWLRINRI